MESAETIGNPSLERIDWRRLIAELLGAEDPDARRKAAEDLSEHRELSAIAALSAALRDTDKHVREAAAQALCQIGGPKTARAIVEYITDQNSATRDLAADLLTRLGYHSVQPLLLYLCDSDPGVRKSAVDILGRIHSDDAVSYLLPLIHDPDQNLVTAVVEALGNIRSKTAIPHLLWAFQEYDFVRAAAAEALGKIGDVNVSGFLLKHLDESLQASSTDPHVTCALVEALGAVGDEKALQYLHTHIHALEYSLRAIVLHTMVQLSEGLHRPLPVDPVLRAFLLEALQDSSLAIRSSAAKALADYPDGEVTRGLAEALGSSEELADLLIPILAAREDSLLCFAEIFENAQTRTSTSLILAVKKTAEALRRDFKVGKDSILEAGLIEKVFRGVAKEWSRAEKETRARIIETLFALHAEAAVTFSEKIVDDPDPGLRVHLIGLLACISDQRAEELIARFVDDEDENVRKVAKETIQARETLFRGAQRAERDNHSGQPSKQLMP